MPKSAAAAGVAAACCGPPCRDVSPARSGPHNTAGHGERNAQSHEGAQGQPERRGLIGWQLVEVEVEADWWCSGPPGHETNHPGDGN